MLITLTPGGIGRRKNYFPWRINSGGSPTDSKGGPHRFKRWPPQHVWHGTLVLVALWSVWGMDSKSCPHRFKRWPPPRAWRGTLVCVALWSVWGMDSRGAPPQIQEVAPTTCVAWHFSLCGTWFHSESVGR